MKQASLEDAKKEFYNVVSIDSYLNLRCVELYPFPYKHKSNWNRNKTNIFIE